MTDPQTWPILPDPLGVWRHTILGAIETHREELTFELGDFELLPMPPGTPYEFQHQVIMLNWQKVEFRAYMSDHHADARLMVDDYFPEEIPEIETGRRDVTRR